jgi:predicted nucleic acid-binding protein
MSGLIVIDASVILKWVLPPDAEPNQPEALAVAEALTEGDVDVALPILWYFEVGNILIRKYPEHADNDLADLRDQLASFEKPMTDDWQRQILALTNRHRVTFYDAAYHALAILNDGIFVTADEKYLEAVSDDKHAMHLKDWR